jgi:hypothetical protein
MNGITAALATRFDVKVTAVKPYLHTATVRQWGRIRRIDSDAGDIMHAASMSTPGDDRRDATYIRVCSSSKCSILLPSSYTL